MLDNKNALPMQDHLLAAVLGQTEGDGRQAGLQNVIWEPGHVGLDSSQGKHGLYYVQHGRLELVVADAGGGERSLRLLGDTDVFGLDFLAPASPTAAVYQVRALTVASILIVSPEVVERWIQQSPVFRQALACRIASGIWNLERGREQTLSRPVRERLVCYLRCGEYCDGHSPTAQSLPRGPLPMHVLARRIGCSAGHLSRAARHLLQDGVVQRVRGGLQISDLRRFAGRLCEDCAD